jgi:hypothetical protein
VTLAVVVGRWSIEQSQKTSESVVRQSLIDEKCEPVSIGGFVVCPDKINISNRGNLIINSFRISCEGSSNDEKVDLKPGKSFTKTLNNCNTVSILPLMTITETEIIGCSDKKMVLKFNCE